MIAYKLSHRRHRPFLCDSVTVLKVVFPKQFHLSLVLILKDNDLLTFQDTTCSIQSPLPSIPRRTIIASNLPKPPVLTCFFWKLLSNIALVLKLSQYIKMSINIVAVNSQNRKKTLKIVFLFYPQIVPVSFLTLFITRNTKTLLAPANKKITYIYKNFLIRNLFNTKYLLSSYCVL